MFNKKLFLLLFIHLTFVAVSNAQLGVIGRMKTEIVTPISVVETEQLDFGKIVSTADGGTVSVSPESERVATGNLGVMNDRFNAGKFVLTATPGSLVTLTLPHVPQRLLSEKSGNEISVDKFVSNIPEGGQVIRQSDGRCEVSVGATLQIGDWQSTPAGFYTGTYEVVFMYN